MQKKTELQKLYEQIPNFKCKPGCTACCGLVPWSDEEWERLDDKRPTYDYTCPYASQAGCLVYAKRPLTCRLFGVVDHFLMHCPHGTAERLLTPAQSKKMLKGYVARVRLPPRAVNGAWCE
jgi:uncharacterized protein